MLAGFCLSGYSDSNGGPPAPKAGALANCATPRLYKNFPFDFGTAKLNMKIDFAKKM